MNRRSAFSLIELLVVIGVIAVLAAIIIPVGKSMKMNANKARAGDKLRVIGGAFTRFAARSDGLLPWEDVSGRDDWSRAAQDDAKEAWYNVIPEDLGKPSVGELASNPRAFYKSDYPLMLEWAPYPRTDKKLLRPYFSVAMNSRLQRKNAEGIKIRGNLNSVVSPSQTVIFFERGLPRDEKVSKAQKGFDGNAKANPRAFVTRYNQQGWLGFGDGHVDLRMFSQLVDVTGQIYYPQEDVIWTADPDADPN